MNKAAAMPTVILVTVVCILASYLFLSSLSYLAFWPMCLFVLFTFGAAVSLVKPFVYASVFVTFSFIFWAAIFIPRKAYRKIEFISDAKRAMISAGLVVVLIAEIFLIRAMRERIGWVPAQRMVTTMYGEEYGIPALNASKTIYLKELRKFEKK